MTEVLRLEDKLHEFKNLYVSNEFGWDIDNGDEDDAITWLENMLYNANIKRPVNVAAGVSKAVIILDDYDKVLKIPMLGAIYYEEKYDEETEEYYYSDESSFDEYTGAPDGDYCALEEMIYYEAEKDGFAKYFAKTEFYGYTKNGYPLYMAEKCTPFYYGDHKPSENSKTIVKRKRNSNSHGWHSMNSDITAIFVDHYGEEEMDKFFQYIYEKDITDLHSGNVMFNAKGKIVLSDYSGFHN